MSIKYYKIIAATGVVLFSFLLFNFIKFGIIIQHQIRNEKYQNPETLSIIDQKYSREGILLIVRSHSEITAVLRQGGTYFHPYLEVPFKTIKTDSDDIVILLNQYPFKKNAEWYLELFSKDGHWYSMSPYFNDSPDISSENWNQLWSSDTNTMIKKEELLKQYNLSIFRYI